MPVHVRICLYTLLYIGIMPVYITCMPVIPVHVVEQQQLTTTDKDVHTSSTVEPQSSTAITTIPTTTTSSSTTSLSKYYCTLHVRIAMYVSGNCYNMSHTIIGWY